MPANRASDIEYELEHFCEDCYHCRKQREVEEYCGARVSRTEQICEPGGEDCAWSWKWDELQAELEGVAV